MASSEKHRKRLLDFLGDPENEFPTRTFMAVSILGFHDRSALYKAFTKEELTEIENEALEERKKRSAPERARAYNALARKAASGDVTAIKELLDRTEGKVQDKLKLSGELSIEKLSDDELDSKIKSLCNDIDNAKP